MLYLTFTGRTRIPDRWSWEHQLGREDLARLDASDELENLGWAKVDCQLDNYASFNMDRVSNKTIDGIYDFFVNHGIDRIIVYSRGHGDAGCGDAFMTLNRFIDKFGKSNKIDFIKGNWRYDSRGWIDKYGCFYGMNYGMEDSHQDYSDLVNHSTIAGNILIKDFEMDEEDIESINCERYLDNQGWVKIDIQSEYVAFNAKMNNAQLNTIYDLFVSSGLGCDNSITVYGGRDGDKRMSLSEFIDEFGKSENIDFEKGDEWNSEGMIAGWISPDGEIVDCTEISHILGAERYLYRQYMKYFNNAELKMEELGWVKFHRFFRDNRPSIYFTAFPTHRQVDIIFDLYGDCDKINVNERIMKFDEFIDEFGKSLYYDLTKSIFDKYGMVKSIEMDDGKVLRIVGGEINEWMNSGRIKRNRGNK